MYQETLSEHRERLSRIGSDRSERWRANYEDPELQNTPEVRGRNLELARKALERRIAHKYNLPTRLKSYSKSEQEALRTQCETSFDDPIEDWRWARIGLRVKFDGEQLVPMTEEEAKEEFDAARFDNTQERVTEIVQHYKELSLENIFGRMERGIYHSRFVNAPTHTVLYKHVKSDEETDNRQHTKFWLDGGRLLTDLSFEAEQIEVGKVAVRVTARSNGEVIDTFITTGEVSRQDCYVMPEAVIYTKEQGVEYGGKVYLRAPTEAQFAAMLPQLELDLGDGGPPDPTVIFTLNREQALDATKNLKCCVSDDESRSILTGIHIDPTSDGFTFVATDTYRIMTQHVEGSRQIQTISEHIVLPVEVLLLLEKFDSEEVTIELGEQPELPADNKWVYRIMDGNRQVTGHLTLKFGIFPAWFKVMDGDIPLKGEVRLGTKRDLLAAIKTLGKIDRKATRRVLIEQNGAGVQLTCEDDDMNTHTTDPIPNSHIDHLQAVNINYLKDWLYTLKADDEVIATPYPCPNYPPKLLFEHKDRQYMVMPMRV